MAPMPPLQTVHGTRRQAVLFGGASAAAHAEDVEETEGPGCRELGSSPHQGSVCVCACVCILEGASACVLGHSIYRGGMVECAAVEQWGKEPSKVFYFLFKAPSGLVLMPPGCPLDSVGLALPPCTVIGACTLDLHLEQVTAQACCSTCSTRGRHASTRTARSIPSNNCCCPNPSLPSCLHTHCREQPRQACQAAPQQPRGVQCRLWPSQRGPGHGPGGAHACVARGTAGSCGWPTTVGD